MRRPGYEILDAYFGFLDRVGLEEDVRVRQWIRKRLGRIRIELVVRASLQITRRRRHPRQRSVERGDRRREAGGAWTLMVEAAIHFDHTLQTAIELDQIRRLRVITVLGVAARQRERHRRARTGEARVRRIE